MLTFTNYRQKIAWPCFSSPDTLLSSKDYISLQQYFNVVIFNLLLGGGSWTLLKRTKSMGHSQQKNTHNFAPYFWGAGEVPGTLEAFLCTPDTEPAFQSGKTSGDRVCCEFYIHLGLSQKTRIQIRGRGNIWCPYSPCNFPSPILSSAHIAWEHILFSGPSWCLLASRQWLIYMDCTLFLLRYKKFIDLTINSFAWILCKPSVSGC